MLQIDRDTNQIVIQKLSIAEKQWSIVLAVVFCLIAYFALRNFGEMPLFGVLWVVGALTGISLQLYVNLSVPAVTIKISKIDKVITISQRSLFKSDFKIYFFDDVKDVFIDTSTAERNVLQLRLRDNTIIKLLEPDNVRLSDFFAAADLINNSIFEKNHQNAFKTPLYFE